MLQGQKKVQVINLNRFSLGQKDLDGQFDTQPRQDLKQWTGANIVEWFPTENNLYAEKLALRAIRSVTHANCLATKLIYTVGTGFTTEDKAFQRYMLGAGVNALDDTFEDVFRGFVDNAYHFGNAFVECVKIGDNIFYYYVDSTKVRIAKPAQNSLESEGFYIAPDWTEADKYGNAPQKNLEPTYYPKFPNFQKVKGQKGLRCIAHWKNRKPNFYYYGLPDYVAALPDIDNEYRIGKYNLDEFDNSFQADYILLAYSDTDDETEAKELKEKLEKDYSGEGKNGKNVFQVLSQDSKPFEAIKLDRNTDGKFLELSSRCEKNISQAHQVPQALAGIAQAGQLGNMQELKNGYEIFTNNVIKPNQSKFIKWWKHLLVKSKQLGADNIQDVPEDLTIKMRKPISFVGTLSADHLLKVNEGREELGREPLEGEEGEKIIIQNGINNSRTSNSDSSF